MCDPILVTLLKIQRHYSQSSHENATPSSGTSPVASYKEVPPPPPGVILSVPVRYKPNPSASSLFVFIHLEAGIITIFLIKLTTVHTHIPGIVGSSLKRTFRQSGLAYWTNMAFLLTTMAGCSFEFANIKTMCFATTRFTSLRVTSTSTSVLPPVPLIYILEFISFFTHRFSHVLCVDLVC